MRKIKPLVSVIMPVHNGERYLRAAIESILQQNEVSFEFIIIDDCSEDETNAIIRSYHDERIVLLRNSRQEGVARCLNQGMNRACGTYIARMDADDISLPGRLKKQVDALCSDTQIGICGTSVEYLGTWHGRERKFFTRSEELRVILFFANPFAHPTVMMNRSLFIKHHLEYDRNFAVAQDYDLWERASRKMKLLKLPDVLLQYRMHPKNVTSKHKDIALPLLYQVYSRMLQHIGLNATEDDLKLHHQIASRNRLASFEEILKAENWLLNIQDKAFTAQVYDNEALMRVLGYFWFELTRNCGNLGIASFMKYRTSRLRRWYFPGIQDLTTYFLSCLWYQLLSQYKKNKKIPWHRPN